MNIISQGKHKTERRPNLTWLQIPPRSEDVTEPNSSSSLLPPLSGAKVGRNGLPPGVLARHGLRSRASTDKLNLLTSPTPTGTLKGPPDSSLPHSGSSVQLYAKRTSSLPIRKNGQSLVSPDSSQDHGQFVDVDPYCEVVYTFSISFLSRFVCRFQFSNDFVYHFATCSNEYLAYKPCVEDNGSISGHPNCVHYIQNLPPNGRVGWSRMPVYLNGICDGPGS